MNKNIFIFIGLAVAILTVLFLVLSPNSETQPATTTQSAPQAFAFTIREGRKISGPAVMQVVQGAEVRLIVNADRDDEIHVHGYDIARDLPNGETVELAFTADRSGRFAIELHATHSDMSVLQVQPR